MSSSTSTTKKAGGAAKVAKTLSKERKRVQRLSATGVAERRKQLAEMTAKDIRAELKQLKQDEWNGDDAGLLKAKSFQLYGLGEPPKKAWTKAGAVYMLDEREFQYEPEQVLTKATAVATLEKAMQQVEHDSSSSDNGSDGNVSKTLFTTPSTKAQRRAELIAELEQLEGQDRGTKKSKGQTGDGWGKDLTTDERRELATEWLEDNEPELSSREDGWKGVVHFQATEQYVSDAYGKEELRGEHFYTATVRYLMEHPQMTKWDTTGYGSVPGTTGNHDVAEEWLGEMYRVGVKRLGGGAQFSQIRFSKVARKGLAGAGSTPPDPIHLAMLFTQLFQAGEKGGRQRTGDGNGSEKDEMRTSRGHVEVPEGTLERIVDTAEQMAPVGMDRSIIRKAAKAVAAQKGETFRDKQITGLKSLGQGRAKGGEGKEFGDLVSMVAINAKQQTEATISLSTEALWTARITAGNAGSMNPETKEVQKCILAILQRNFTSENFKLYHMVAQIPGTPSTTALSKAFGEANECKVDGRASVHSTAAEDRFHYTFLQRAMQALQVVVTPDLDVGFASGVKWFAEGITSFVANGTPMAMVTRAVSRFLLQAQRQRHQELMFADESGEEMLCFRETEAITNSKVKLLDWNRDAQVDQQIQWTRCMEQARTTGSTSMGNHDNKTWGHQGNQDRSGGNRSVHFQQQVKQEGGGNSGKQSDARNNGMEINVNKIDKPKWKREYGETRVNGKVVLLCWYNSNRVGGCVKEATCTYDHKHYPEEYKGKPLSKCGAAFQKEVLKKCPIA
jgi:hypothetical protein